MLTESAGPDSSLQRQMMLLGEPIYLTAIIRFSAFASASSSLITLSRCNKSCADSGRHAHVAIGTVRKLSEYRRSAHFSASFTHQRRIVQFDRRALSSFLGDTLHQQHHPRHAGARRGSAARAGAEARRGRFNGPPAGAAVPKGRPRPAAQAGAAPPPRRAAARPRRRPPAQARSSGLIQTHTDLIGLVRLIDNYNDITLYDTFTMTFTLLYILYISTLTAEK